MSDGGALHTDLTGGVLTLSLDHPPVNALSLELIAQLNKAFTHAGQDRTVRCVILTGYGDHFCVGQDIHDFLAEDIPFRFHMLRSYNPLILGLRSLQKPVLAAVNGMAAGAGLGIALACDLRLASNQAQFVVGFTGIGLIPDCASSLLLPALIGIGRALEFTFSNSPISAGQALEWGLVNRVTPHAELQEKAAEWAGELAEGPTLAFGLAKRAFNRAVLGNLEEALDYEAHLQEIASRTPEHKEGVKAFLEKRPPNFNL
jgi:2-(1,2-epoxy-1,2-dihydrophenyl)acetyl-CoA isomerase